MYVPITDTDLILYLLLVSDSFNENEHFLNNYDYRKAINDVIHKK